jgi:hypothetical protein
MSKDRILISHEIPAIYPQLEAKFGVSWDNGLIIAYDGRVHCKQIPPAQKIVHEEVHLLRQKKMGNEVWWKLYLENEKFRFDEELVAYLAEANFIKKHIKDRELVFHAISDIASSFSSSTYGKIIDKGEALRLLRK